MITIVLSLSPQYNFHKGEFIFMFILQTVESINTQELNRKGRRLGFCVFYWGEISQEGFTALRHSCPCMQTASESAVTMHVCIP